MIPLFEANGNLPPGLHEATWQEFTSRFGETKHRRELLKGLYIALKALKLAGCKHAYIDGSFTTTKAVPDFDGCWDEEGVNVELLFATEPALLQFDNKRAAQKARLPDDFDGCWDEEGVNVELLFATEPALLQFDNKRAAQKARFGGELFPSGFPADKQQRTFLQFFQIDRDGNPKGIIVLALESLP